MYGLGEGLSTRGLGNKSVLQSKVSEYRSLDQNADLYILYTQAS